VTWTLEHVKFDDGATAVGSFVYDASQGTVVDFDVSLSFPGYSRPFIFYPNDLPCEPCISASASGQGTENLHVTFSTGSHYGEFVELVTAHTLTDKGGTIALVPGVRLQEGGPFLFSGSGFQCCGLGKDNGILVSGALVGTIVPEPSDALFLALGLVMLVASLSSRRKLLSVRAGSCVSKSTAT
jgi:hypothetical protein